LAPSTILDGVPETNAAGTQATEEMARRVRGRSGYF
jgi:hypothetical protein